MKFFTMSSEELLTSLEVLIHEFYNISTTNERKRQIEEILENFKNQPECWKHCLSFLSNTSNEFVMMYCLTVLEYVINKLWIRMPGPDKAELRTKLNSFMINHHLKVPNYITNKLGKLIVDIGRHDWPHFYPDFYMNIHQLAQSSETAPLGLMLIITSFEEFTSPREDVAVTRKAELHRLMLDQVPVVLNILAGHLDAVLEKHSHLVTATPPPSPTHYQNNSHESLFSTSPLHTGSILSGMFKSTSKNPFQSMPPLDDESHQLSVLALKCLAQLLSWIPLSSYITSSLLTTVFHFASFGCHPEPVMHVGMQQYQPLRKNTDLGIQAMGCINEIMSKQCIPADYEGFLLQVFQDTFHLLQNLTKDNSKSASNRNTLADIDDVYIEKFTYFLQLFVTNHLKRFESSAQFPILEFLALLFKYTFQQPSHDGFYACLEIWNTFLDYLNFKLKNEENNYDVTFNKYREALLALVQEILRKLQFRFNQSSLEELDDEDLDDDSFTEWQSFLCQCLEIASKVSDLMPNEIFNLVYSIFEENLRIYLELERFVKTDANHSPIELSICAENECRRLHCSLRDLSSMLQALGRLVVNFCGDNFVNRKLEAQKILEKLCHAATYSNRLKFYEMKTEAPSVLKGDFIEVHAQILATLKAFCYWLTEYSKENIHIPEENSDGGSIEKVFANIAIVNIKKEVPEKVTHSAAHLLISLTYTVRPALLFQFIPVQELFSLVAKLALRTLPIETQLVVYRSMSNLLILPWPKMQDSQQLWPARSTQHDAFLISLSEPLKSACTNPAFLEDKSLQERAKPDVIWVIKVICGLIENLSDAPTRTKQIFSKSILPLIPFIESLFHLYLQHSDITENILEFYLCLFSVFRVQIGLPFVEKTIQTLLTLFSSNQLMHFTLNESSSGCKVIEKLLQLLQQIVQEPNSQFKAFLPSTINLCLSQIYPLIAERPSSEVKPPLFELLHKILLHNCRYFFKVNVISSLGESGNEKIENEQHFTKIMEAYGQSFLQPDINLFKQNLISLETLNNKWKLYYKGYFKSIMLFQFISVFLQTLIYKTHNLLRDEIVSTIYSMALVDIQSFYSTFLPQFLQSMENLDSNQKTTLLRNFKHETDSHTFGENIQRFVSDIRYYCLCSETSI
ncbi:exportin-6 isoform X2 [Parasteatoda tepidariorum]|uniref:exportin-6 isoform X2 n=1 Tax=Parasteatoda tepidariorum TaxID=114398 RepID=UPI00077FAB1F|nr:exportin-6 isoform X2 [Parasteatoda tepidariorum]